MSDEKIYPVPAAVAARAYIDEQKYQSMYARSIADPEGFWSEQAKQLLDWTQPWTKVTDCDFHTGQNPLVRRRPLECLP